MAGFGQEVSRPDLAGASQASRAREFRQILGDLGGLAGVRGCLIVTADGLVITADLPSRIAGEPLAALAATLGRELEVGAQQLGRDTFKTASFVADDGAVFVAGSPIGFLILVADAAADPVSVTFMLRKALSRLNGSWLGTGGG